jgi:hypothetical protein
MTLNIQYFEELRGKINLRLNDLVKEKKYDKSSAKSQIEEFPWLYGATVHQAKFHPMCCLSAKTQVLPE